MPRIILKMLFIASTTLFFFGSPLFAQKHGGLMVFPKRVVFEAGKRNDVVNLVSSSDDTESYAISFTHVEMQRTGEFKEPDSGATNIKYADSIVRFFPRLVTLPPHGSQTIRLQYLKPKDLPPGEYRSHLFMRGIERAKPIEAQRSDTDKLVSVTITAIYGISIPVIVRNQTEPAKITLSNLHIMPPDSSNRRAISVEINRSGPESVYGELVATYKDRSGKETVLALAKGLAVYTPLPSRLCSLDFKVPPGVDISSGSVRMEFLSMSLDDKEHKETVLATTEISLPN
ncbi:MAG: hypothetical protein ABI778_07515 [Ignavibacteriota bacterium]